MFKRIRPWLLDSDLTHVEQDARMLVRTRLRTRDHWSARDIIRESAVDPAYERQAHVLLNGLAKVIGVDAGTIRPSDWLGDLLGVSKQEIAPAAALVLEENGRDRIQVFSYDVLHLLQTIAIPQVWKRQAKTLPAPPRNEEEWIDQVMGMQLGEFLRFFSATVRTDLTN